ncbi:hypothetical protein Tco_0134022 [Tanacetum coccineum]
MQKTILKQQYEIFTASRSEGLDKTYDRFQKHISQLEIHSEVISQENANLKLLRMKLSLMKEAEPVQKKTKLQLEQERLGLEEALRLQEQLDEEERQRIGKVHEEASTFNAEEWDNI